MAFACLNGNGGGLATIPLSLLVWISLETCRSLEQSFLPLSRLLSMMARVEKLRARGRRRERRRKKIKGRPSMAARDSMGGEGCSRSFETIRVARYFSLPDSRSQDFAR